MTDVFPRGWVIAFSFLAAVTTLAGVFFPDVLPSAALRILVAIQLALLASRLVSPKARPGLLNPLFLLPVVAYALFVIAPACFATLPRPSFIMPEIHARYASYFGSPAERIVLQFVSLCLLAGIYDPFARSAMPVRRDAVSALLLRDRRRIGAAACAVAGGAAAIKLMDTKLGLLDAVPVPGAGGVVHDALPPVIYFCLAAAIAIAQKGPPREWLLTGLWSALCLFVLVSSDLARMPLAFATFAILMIISLNGVHFRRAMMIGAITILVGALSAVAAHSFRQLQAAPKTDFSESLVQSLSGKLMLRQAVSGWCLDRVVERHWDTTANSLPIGPVAGLVPRILWPGKPAVSRGGEYAVEYCNAIVSKENPHSEALTLLAEPIMEGGKLGLFVGEALIILLLAVVAALMARFGTIAVAAGTALLPWLTAFEQELAFFVANSTKMFLFMLPFAIALHLFARRKKDMAEA